MGGERFYSNDNWKEEVLKLRNYAESLDMTFVQAHSPDGKIWNPEDADRYVKLATRSVEICEILGIPQVVVHAGYQKDVSSDEFYEKNRDFYKRLFPIMEKTGVNVLVENTSSKNLPKEVYNHPISGKELLDFIQYVDHPLLHAVWDTGHFNTEGPQYEQIMALGKELYGIHVHDNSGQGDEHTLPYLGIINMDDVMHGLLDVGYKGCFTFEAGGVLRRSNNRHGKRYVFEEDTR